ncbi:hypothetical protein C8Q73DRAFT_831476 [Cubamyces lactineus]|nr:hypothetical protein C8Q73DRAFT_831476 [Cubamyces lactineus]
MSFKPAVSRDAAVVARAIIQASELSDQQKSDVFESTLFAQAAASKQSTSKTEEEAIAWYRVFVSTLGSVGWAVQKANFTEVHCNKAGGSVDDTILESLTNDADVDNQQFLHISKALLAYARAGKDSPATRVFDKASVSSNSKFASFQVAVASRDGDNVVLTLYAYLYTSDQKVGNALWHQWRDAKMSMKTSKVVMTLNSDVYAKVRSGIHDKLKTGGKLSSVVRIFQLCHSATLSLP